MSNQATRKLDTKSSKLLKALRTCNAKLGGDDYAPIGFEVRQRPFETGPQPKSLRVPPVIADGDFLRFRAWLRELDEADQPKCFSALLQIWLDAYGISWPRGVFKEDLAIPGSGVLAGNLGRSADRLKQEGKTWGQIAKTLLRDEELSTPEARVKASDKVRHAAESYRNGVRREVPVEGSVAAFAWKMLAIKPDWVYAAELRDEFGSDALDEPSGAEEKNS
jgi:hypothetical protein